MISGFGFVYFGLVGVLLGNRSVLVFILLWVDGAAADPCIFQDFLWLLARFLESATGKQPFEVTPNDVTDAGL